MDGESEAHSLIILHLSLSVGSRTHDGRFFEFQGMSITFHLCLDYAEVGLH